GSVVTRGKPGGPLAQRRLAALARSRARRRVRARTSCGDHRLSRASGAHHHLGAFAARGAVFAIAKRRPAPCFSCKDRGALVSEALSGGRRRAAEWRLTRPQFALLANRVSSPHAPFPLSPAPHAPPSAPRGNLDPGRASAALGPAHGRGRA